LKHRTETLAKRLRANNCNRKRDGALAHCFSRRFLCGLLRSCEVSSSDAVFLDHCRAAVKTMTLPMSFFSFIAAPYHALPIGTMTVPDSVERLPMITASPPSLPASDLIFFASDSRLRPQL